LCLTFAHTGEHEADDDDGQCTGFHWAPVFLSALVYWLGDTFSFSLVIVKTSLKQADIAQAVNWKLEIAR
jgi:hypothetical protein